MLDRIRFRLDQIHQDSHDYSEFTWFAREYPRCYRYHLDCAEHRLRGIRRHFEDIHNELAPRVAESPTLFGIASSNHQVQRIYWDFESFLSEVNIALDLLARVAGTAYRDQMPTSFNRFCKKTGNDGLLRIMKRAQTMWVRRLKDYRDCFTHFTPVDTLLSVGLVQYSDGFHIRAKLPVNPNVREILGFRFSRRTEVLRYCFTVWRRMTALDRATATWIARAFRQGEYPKRTSRLFFLGRRTREETT